MTQDHNRQKKIAVINDMTGFGRCALTVSIPVISKLKVQCCPVPTAILSNHTAFASCFFDDYTEHFEEYTGEWEKLGLIFNGIATGFIGSAGQFPLIEKFIDTFKGDESIVLVDPVMGDNGALYSSYDEEMCARMRDLAGKADILTPNLTEACILAEVSWHEGPWSIRELRDIVSRLAELGPGRIVITGIPQGEFVANMCAEKVYDGSSADAKPGLKITMTRQHRIGDSRFGTGDIFASVLIADSVNGVPFPRAVRRASRFVKLCIEKTVEMGLPRTDGVCFEEVLDRLKA